MPLTEQEIHQGGSEGSGVSEHGTVEQAATEGKHMPQLEVTRRRVRPTPTLRVLPTRKRDRPKYLHDSL